ncbi:hypothetical protein CI15_24755 [Paraburkholderia monticola]|uniref:Autotransporter domain-containing protein n=1 Tax=Paraburkholderia monticola TaxID=1399968 RepID=A0A149PFE2_9BURK|nr:autotransporter domain-containing protein [Paraburkholderia monticola]KXU83760.1 hypothetical protein CI15_24755 [Paraburkholderia monticola]
MTARFNLRPLTFCILASLGAVTLPALAQTDASYVAHPISTNVSDWSSDRQAPYGNLINLGQYEGRGNVLSFGIDPPASVHSFYNWQGYNTSTHAAAGNSFIGGDLWVNPAWQAGSSTDYVRTGMWGAAMPSDTVASGKYVDSKTSMPIMSFTNKDGVGRLEVWDTTVNPDSGWVDLPETAGLIHYGSWNSIDMRLLPGEGKIEYYLNGSLVYTWANPSGDDGSLPQQFWKMYLQGRNNGVTSFQTYWADLASGELIQSGQTIGSTAGNVVAVSSASTPRTPTLVAAGAQIGGSLSAKGTADNPAVVAFQGDTTIGQAVGGSNAVLGFSADPSHTTQIGGDVSLVQSTTTGGSVANPIKVGGNVSADAHSDMGGNWRIAGDLVSSGNLSPGNSIGVIGVGRNLTLSPSSMYGVEVTAADGSDRVAVGGVATLAGGVRVSATDAYKLGHPYLIMTASGGFGGTMFDASQVTWDHPDYLFLAPRLSYGLNDVNLIIDRNGTSYAAAAQTANQAVTARALDTLTFGNAAYESVARATSAASAAQAFDQLSGEGYATARTAMIEDSRFVRDAMNQRLRDKAARSGNATPAAATPVEVWTQAFGDWGSMSGGNGAAAVDTSVSGVFIGADGTIRDAVTIGAMGGYSHSTLDLNTRASSANSDNYHVGMYAGTDLGKLGIRGGAAYTWHQLAMDRSVVLPGYADTLRGNYGGATAQVFGDVGYKLGAGPVVIEPFANAALVNLHTDAFRERGGAGALSGQSSSSNTAFSTLGLRGASDFALGPTMLTTTGTLGWRHAYGTLVPAQTMVFAGSAPYSVTGVPIARNAAVVEANIDAIVGKNARVGVGYSGQIGGGNQSHGVKARFLYRF